MRDAVLLVFANKQDPFVSRAPHPTEARKFLKGNHQLDSLFFGVSYFHFAFPAYRFSSHTFR